MRSLIVLLALALSVAGCGPHRRPDGPRAYPKRHYSNCVSWCPARGLSGYQHTRLR